MYSDWIQDIKKQQQLQRLYNNVQKSHKPAVRDLVMYYPSSLSADCADAFTEWNAMNIFNIFVSQQKIV